MNSNLIFFPVLAHVLLIMWIYLLLAIRKKQALQSGKVDLSRRALFEDAWPDNVIVVNNNIRNQFQVPVLFYIVCFILWATDAVNIWVMSLAVLFVVSRYAHASVHTGDNIVRNRFRLFVFGFLIVFILTIDALLVVVNRTLVS